VMTPVQCLARIAALIPPPPVSRCYASRESSGRAPSSWRSAVVAMRPAPANGVELPATNTRNVKEERGEHDGSRPKTRPDASSRRPAFDVRRSTFDGARKRCAREARNDAKTAPKRAGPPARPRAPWRRMAAATLGTLRNVPSSSYPLCVDAPASQILAAHGGSVCASTQTPSPFMRDSTQTPSPFMRDSVLRGSERSRSVQELGESFTPTIDSVSDANDRNVVAAPERRDDEIRA